MNNQQIKKDLVSKILNLTSIQQNEIFNIIKNNNVKYTCNNNGVFINITKIDIELIKKINVYIDYLKNNETNLKEIEEICINISNNKNNDTSQIYKIINFEEFTNLKNIKFLEKIKDDINFKKKKEFHLKFINTMKKYQRYLLVNYDNENYNNELIKQNYLIKN